MACLSNVEVGSGKNYVLKPTAPNPEFRIWRTALYRVERQWGTMLYNKDFKTKFQLKKKNFTVSFTKPDV